MFCSKCSSPNDDAAKFCKKCGQALPRETGIKEVMVSADNKKPEKKKSKKWRYILGGIAAVIIMILIAASWEGSTDYVATVGKHKPFESKGSSLTYTTVLNKYIDSPKWETRKSGDTGYVDISGTAKGRSDRRLVVTIKVVPNPNDQGRVLISPEAVTINGKKSPTQEDAVKFLFAMFYAYEQGYDTVSELLK